MRVDRTSLIRPQPGLDSLSALAGATTRRAVGLLLLALATLAGPARAEGERAVVIVGDARGLDDELPEALRAAACADLRRLGFWVSGDGRLAGLHAAGPETDALLAQIGGRAFSLRVAARPGSRLSISLAESGAAGLPLFAVSLEVASLREGAEALPHLLEAVLAREQTEPAQSVSAPRLALGPPEPLRGYGLETATADLAALALFTVGLTMRTRVPLVAGGALLLLGAPGVHLLHGNTGVAFSSMAVRAVLPLGAGFLGAEIGAGSAGSQDADKNMSSVFGGAAIGLGVGWLAASILDATWLAFEPIEPQATAWQPTLQLGRKRTTLGVAVAF